MIQQSLQSQTDTVQEPFIVLDVSLFYKNFSYIVATCLPSLYPRYQNR